FHTDVIGETGNPVNKPSVERQCAIARELGQTDKHPVFEPGHDRPLATESRRFANAHHGVSFDTLHAYECDRAGPAAPSTPALCDCTYRPRASHRIGPARHRH